VWRLYSCTTLLALIIFGAGIWWSITHPTLAYANPYSDTAFFTPLIIGMLTSIFSWAIVIIADIVMMPVEKFINLRYFHDAQRILRSMPSLKIIGITGSYGKTSTKHYLHAMLSEKYDTLMTPGSFNTPMGVIRTVREMMKPYNEVFICEMGAKQKGDVKEICDLVHPDMGIITAVGPMHLETFKTMETVQSTKFELADAIPTEGLIVVNNDFEYCANRKVDNVECVRYTVDNQSEADYKVEDVSCSPEGTSFNIVCPDGRRISLRTRLIGDSNLSNLLGASIVALRLGLSEEQLSRAIAHIEQVEHRLSMKRTAAGVTIIDDAYNSNPVGSRMAVEALGRFTGGKRIVVTPGMIELGEKQEELNREFGRHIARNVDLAVVVGHYNRRAIIDGINSEEALPEDAVVTVDTFNEAMQYLNPRLRKGDTILIENDLPDTFN